MKRLEENPKLMRIFAWSGPFLVACWIAALVGYGRFIPDKSPSEPASVIQHFYLAHTTALRIDTVVLMLTGGFWATWGAAIATFIKRMERGWLLTFSTIALVGGGYVFFEFVALFWGVAAFRPGGIPASTTLTLHDLGWFSVLFDWPPFALFNIVLGTAILRDKNAVPVLPRWVGYMSIWCAMVFVPAGLIIFMKHGPIAYNGLIALYIPLGTFFAWMCGFTIGVMQSLKRDAKIIAEQERQDALTSATDATTTHEPAPAPA
jgi:hypothetical protein